VLLATVLGMSAAALRAAWRNQLVIRAHRSTSNLVASIDAIERLIAVGGEKSGQVQWPIGKMPAKQELGGSWEPRTIRVTWKPSSDTKDIEIIAEELWGQKTAHSLRKGVASE